MLPAHKHVRRNPLNSADPRAGSVIAYHWAAGSWRQVGMVLAERLPTITPELDCPAAVER
jgi:hypothetical protein